MEASEWRNRYNNYINSEEWREKRDTRLAISHYRCSACPSTVSLTVHHLTYKRLGLEDMMDLLPLCKDCHNCIEEIIKEGKFSRTGNPLWLATETVRLILSCKKDDFSPSSKNKEKVRNRECNAAKVQRELVQVTGFKDCVMKWNRKDFKREIRKIIGTSSNKKTNAFAIYDRFHKTGNFLMPGRE